MVFYGIYFWLIGGEKGSNDQGEEALRARCARLENELVELYHWLRLDDIQLTLED